MKLLVNVIRVGLRAAGVLGAALLVSCGGGDRVEDFKPTRLLVFGDETSVIDDSASEGKGRKYTVNALEADNVTLLCESNAIWIQYLVAAFTLPLRECNPGAVSDPKSRIYAEAGDKVADVVAQVDTHLLADTFSGTDLVTVLAGANDILEQYALYDGTNEALLTQTVQAAGSALAGQVNRIANAGGKVLIATVPDMGLTPFAVTENLANAGRAELLTRLTAAFNERVRAGIQNDGRKIGLLLVDEQVQTLVKFPSLYSLANVTTAVCDPVKAPTVDQCTQQTLVTDGSSSTYLWADATHLSPAGHRSVGQAATTRATNNPF
jgi:outer membrane lipase/esterase